MSTTKEDRSFKTLINRETTDSANKFFFNELGADTINVHTDDVWSDSINFDDPAAAVAAGIVEQRTLQVLTEDPTVPNQQCWKAVSPSGDISNTRLKDWVSTKFGSSYEIKLFDGSDNEIFTTDPVDWFFDYQTGILAFNGDVSAKPKPFKITGYRYIGNKGLRTATRSDMVIPVDYEDGTAVDPPSGKVFSSQVDIDDFLSAQGATAFKHLNKLLEALPVIISHIVRVDLAGGVHRPHDDDTDQMISLRFTVLPRGHLRIIGDSPENWTALANLNDLTIDSSDSGINPYVDVSSSHPSAFSGFDLRGLHVVSDEGEVSVIFDHTDDRLFLCGYLTSPTTITVARPNTIIRNSQDDSTQHASIIVDSRSEGYNWGFSSDFPESVVEGDERFGLYKGSISFLNIRWDDFADGATDQILVHTSSDSMQRGRNFAIQMFQCLNDKKEQQAQFGLGDSGRAIQSTAGLHLVLDRVGFRASSGGPGNVFYLRQSSLTVRDICVVGFRSGIYFRTGSCYLQNAVFIDGGGSTDYWISLYDAYFWFAWSSFFAGPGNRFYGKNLEFVGQCFNSLPDGEAAQLNAKFYDQTGPAVLIKGINNTLDGRGTSVSDNGLVDGGGNSDVGIQMEGSHNVLLLDDGTDVSGTAGDLRIEGAIASYEDLGSVNSPTNTIGFNSIGREE